MLPKTSVIGTALACLLLLAALPQAGAQADKKIDIVILSLDDCKEYALNKAHYVKVGAQFEQAGYDATIKCEPVDKLKKSVAFYNTLKSKLGYAKENVLFAMPTEYAPFDTDKYDGYAWWKWNVGYVELSYYKTVPISCDGQCVNEIVPVYTFDIMEHESHHLVCDCNFHGGKH